MAKKKKSKPVSAKALYTPETLDFVVDRLTQAPDPDHVLNRIGKSRADLRGLEGDDEIAQCIETRRSALSTSPWRIEKLNSTKTITEWVKDAVEPFHTKLTGAIWEAVPYGYSVVRPVYARPEPGAPALAKIGGLQRIEVMPFEHFRPNSHGEWGREPVDTLAWKPLTEQELTYLYFVTIRQESVRNRYGSALLSRAYWAWFYRYNAWMFWGQYLERFGTPLLVGQSMDPEDMVVALAKAVQDAVIAVGMEEDVKPVFAQGNGEPFANMEDRLIKRIQKLILGQTLTSDISSKGSFAAASVHNQVRMDKRREDIELITPTMQRIVNALVYLRFGPTAVAPRYQIDDETGLQPERAQRDATLKQSGIIKKFSEDYLIRTYDLNEGEFEVGDGEETTPALQTESE